MISHLNVTYASVILLTLGTIFGVLPSETAFLIALIYIGYILYADTRSATSLVIRSIPFFIAIPFSETFDNFNIWRLALLLLFLKWGFDDGRFLKVLRYIPSLNYRHKQTLTKYSVEIAGSVFLLLTALSVLAGLEHVGHNVMRVIYIINGVFLFVVVRSLVLENKENARIFCKDFLIPTGLVLLIGYTQFIVAYFIASHHFLEFWGEVASTNHYGTVWGEIVRGHGNTWFSYAGETTRLRMFSIFPGSHSFPMYMILAIPAFFALCVASIQSSSWKKYLISRQGALHLAVFFIGITAILLSGTRGIWIASIAPLILMLVLWQKNTRQHMYSILLFFGCVVLAFGVYISVVSFQQFKDSHATTDASIQRLTSVIDITETSNKGRLDIWNKTLDRIQERPLLGVGVANFPLVLDEPLEYSLKGSSAHNIYLHIAVTTGILSLLVFCGVMFEFVRRGVIAVKRKASSWVNAYQLATGFAILWLMCYEMTDTTLFDGRVMLGFMVVLGIATGLYHATYKLNKK